jgi:hypothetical protein
MALSHIWKEQKQARDSLASFLHVNLATAGDRHTGRAISIHR